MSARIAKLEALLQRIRDNSERGRPLATSAPRSSAPLQSRAASGSGAPRLSAPFQSRAASPSAAVPLAGSPASGAARGGLGGASPSEISGPGGFELDEPGLSEPPPPDDDILKVDPDDLLLEDEESPPESGAGPVGGVQTLSDAMRAEEGQPPLTPPPESGEEPAPQVQIPKDPGPTMEQLGNTIQLDEAGATDFELDDVTRSPWRSSGDDARESSPAEEPATLPPGAREELDRVRLGQVREVRPVAIDRPVISTNVVDFVSAAREFEPETFLELLDSSLSL